ncbi:hypothetical protein GHT06_009708 [Daphnia sinensis]|uniref:TNF receptor-associated factor 4 n=1 Tax=Daphnia sinensis TaxID=1820382 RepID=A0AAD5LPM8_9CRUS|nr:hypothetical protein GHT06_009708 [Daphnia sinensis]
MVRKCGWRSELSSPPPSVLPPTPPARHSTSSSSSSYQRKSSRWTFYDATQLTSVYPESSSQKTIFSSVVYCIHRKEGCEWNGELRKLKAHLLSCSLDAIPCRMQCGQQVSRLAHDDHGRNFCPNRRQICDYCQVEFNGLQYDSHVGTCTMEPVYCDNKCGQKISRKQMMQHKAIECGKRLVACRYCAKDFSYDTLPAHHAKCGRYPIACPNQCDSPKVVREELESHLKDNCPALMVSCPFKEAGCRFKGPRFSLDKHQEEGMKQHLLLMCGLATRQQQQLSTLRSTVSRVSLNYTGTFLWRINDVQTKIAEARIKEGFELISAPFYTSQYGYKLQASLFLNGNGSGEGAYVSIYIKILPGEYDALLKWPFSHTVSFTLYDQAANPDKACNIVESFIPDPTWENFQRPSREPDALGFGFPRFVSHDMLKKRHFVKDDVLFLKVRVDPAKNMAV